MKRSILILVILLSVAASYSYGQSIEVYYFHMSRRCATCLAVESESEAALKKLYPAQMESGLISFKEVNLEEESSEELAKKLEVSGQTLLIVKGDQKIDLTGDGFKYARSSPEKLQDSFKAAIDPLL